MISDNQKLQFLNGLCEELNTHGFAGNYAVERDLYTEIVRVVAAFCSAGPYRDDMTAWDADQWPDVVTKINAFGRESRPDVCVNLDGAPFIAVEVKLLRDYWGLQRGIGQAVVDSVAYEYGIVFALDKRKPNPGKHQYDDELTRSLWDSYRTRIVIRGHYVEQEPTR